MIVRPVALYMVDDCQASGVGDCAVSVGFGMLLRLVCLMKPMLKLNRVMFKAGTLTMTYLQDNSFIRKQNLMVFQISQSIWIMFCILPGPICLLKFIVDVFCAISVQGRTPIVIL